MEEVAPSPGIQDAEAALWVLGTLLNWNGDGRYAWCAEYGNGMFTITCDRGRYQCCFLREREFEGMSGDWDRWWYRAPSLALSRCACDWYAATGDWPTDAVDGWGFLKR